MRTLENDKQIRRVRHELRFRTLKVLRKEQITPNFMQVVVGGPDLEGFTSLSFDDHIKIMLSDVNGNEIRRDYTPRQYNAEKQELVLEFAIHDGGNASNWSQQVAIGDSVVIGGPRGSMIIPDDFAAHVLIGDMTALPAFHRRIEELPATAKITVIVKIESAEDQREFVGRDVTAIWVQTDEALLAAVQSISVVSDSYYWCAGENSLMHQTKSILVEEKAVSPKSMSVGSYWKKGVSDFHEHH